MNSVFVFISVKKNVNLSGKKTYEFTSNLPEFFRPNPPRSWKTSLGTHALCGRGPEVDSADGFTIRDRLVGRMDSPRFVWDFYITYLYGGEIIQLLSTMQDIQVCVCDTFLFSKIRRIQPNVVWRDFVNQS